FYTEWRQRRLQLYPNLNGSELRHYYRTAYFTNDLVSFIRDGPASAAPAIAALLEYEDAAQRAVPEQPTCEGEVTAPGEALCWGDITVRRGRTRLVELSFNIPELIASLTVGGEYKRKQEPCFYVWREVSCKTDRLDQISDWMAALLRACDGKRDIRGIVNQLSTEISELDASAREYVALKLLAGAQAEG